jgi:hypothetical protein
VSIIHDAHTCFLEGGKDLLPQMVLSRLDELANLFMNGIQLLFGGQAIGTAFHYATLHLSLKAGHSNHEELFEVGTEDGEKFHTLQQWIVRVFRLLQDSFLEGKKAEFPVNVEPWVGYRTGIARVGQV